MKKILYLPLIFVFAQSTYAHETHSHSQYDQNGHVIRHQALQMTPVQQIIYKKTVAAVLDFLEQFHPHGEDYKEFINKIKNELLFSYDHPYRNRGFCNAFALCRDDYVGVKLKNMSKSQQDKFFDLMQILLAPYGNQKMKNVFGRQSVIFDIEQAYRDDPKKFPVIGGPQGSGLEKWKPIDAKGNPIPRDADDYYIAFFGDLEQFINGNLALNKGFGIRVEGHHLSLNFTFVNKNGHLIVSTAPTFYGSNPMVVPQAPFSSPDKYTNWKLKVGDTFMLSETQIAKLFVKSLHPEEQKLAHYTHMASPMFETAADTKPIESENYLAGNTAGLKISDLQGTKKQIEQKKYLLLEFMKLITATQRDVFLNLQDVKEDMDNMRISFYGGLDKFSEFYFRIQSKKFLLELVQSSNFSIVNPGNIKDKNDSRNNNIFNNNHVHIMFRDLRNDWGYDPLYLHEKQDHDK